MGTSLAGLQGEKRRKGIKPSFHPLPSSVRYLSRMCPSLSPNDNGFAIGIDNATLEEFFQGSPQLVSIAKVVVQDPFLHINPVPSPDLYDFHGNHPLSKQKAPNHKVSGLVGTNLKGPIRVV